MKEILKRDFGIIIACCSRDYIFAKGTCASIRHFLGDVPICLIIDGDFSTRALQKTYNVEVLYRDNVSNPFLKQRSFGWGLTKMVAFWESPWKHFLFLDADTIVWGNVLNYADFNQYDVVIDRPQHKHTDEQISYYFFDIEEITREFPDFDWQKHRNKYFCTGTFFASRDIFEIDEYIEILDLVEENPKLFKFGEMGLLNFMFHRAEDEGKIRIGQESMQLLVPDFDQKELESRFSVNEAGPLPFDRDVVIHWAGALKPTSRARIYSKPMSFARRKYLLDVYGFKVLSDILIYFEDTKYNFSSRMKNLLLKISRRASCKV